MIPHYEAEIKSIWDNSFVGCCRVGVAGAQVGQFLEVNQYFAIKLKYLTSELVGAHVNDVTDFKSRGGIEEFEKVISGELSHFEQEKIYRTKDGNRVPARVHSYPIFENGKLPEPQNIQYSFSIVVFCDTTASSERVIKSLEARVKSNETMVKSLMAMINTPININLNNENNNDQSVDKK